MENEMETVFCRGLYGLGFPKIRGTILGVLIIRIIVFWGLYWGPLICRNYHIIGGLGLGAKMNPDHPDNTHSPKSLTFTILAGFRV